MNWHCLFLWLYLKIILIKSDLTNHWPFKKRKTRNENYIDINKLGKDMVPELNSLADFSDNDELEYTAIFTTLKQEVFDNSDGLASLEQSIADFHETQLLIMKINHENREKIKNLKKKFTAEELADICSDIAFATQINRVATEAQLVAINLAQDHRAAEAAIAMEMAWNQLEDVRKMLLVISSKINRRLTRYHLN